jgi:hypothetical protein
MSALREPPIARFISRLTQSEIVHVEYLRNTLAGGFIGVMVADFIAERFPTFQATE